MKILSELELSVSVFYYRKHFRKRISSYTSFSKEINEKLQDISLLATGVKNPKLFYIHANNISKHYVEHLYHDSILLKAFKKDFKKIL
jgi:hypothetical protein